MKKNLALFLMSLLLVVVAGGGLAYYRRMSEELARARSHAELSEARVFKLDSQVLDLRERLARAEEGKTELNLLRAQAAELKAQLSDLKAKQLRADENTNINAYPFFNREAARSYAEMIARNDAKLAEFARDPDAAARLKKIDALPDDAKQAELARMQQAGDAITVDNQIIPLGTPGLDEKLRQLMVDQANQWGGRRRFGGGRRYEPPPAPPETNDLKF
ncbi:MAG TPA: hypothetical protein VKX17_22885 [Planctomycetota bacterium]|nr:hypothetical protein [Planctomycetota bacterium]